MRICYDTEFIENGKTIDLISIGMVSEEGAEFYAVSNEFDTTAVANHDWLMKNVMSSIEHIPLPNADGAIGDLVVTDDNAMSRAKIRQGILDFVGYDTPEWWAWFGAYDHIALCQLFGTMMELPRGWPMYTNDIVQLANYNYPRKGMPHQGAGLHNALDDARHNWKRLRALETTP